VHENSDLFFGTAKESDQGDAGVQSDAYDLATRFNPFRITG
jgi:hypothetical protein